MVGSNASVYAACSYQPRQPYKATSTMSQYRIHSLPLLLTKFIGAIVITANTTVVFSQAQSSVCEAQSGSARNPVIELYTSEGCSSCPPADRWLSTLEKRDTSQAAVMAFHVSYWDYIGWIDKFAAPVYNERQRQLARQNGQSGVYTPQVVRDGRDWQRWYSATAPSLLDNTNKPSELAAMAITLRYKRNGVVEADVSPSTTATQQTAWRAYWAVTESGHATKVKAGENRGESLQHDFVVRQYETVDVQTGRRLLVLKLNPAEGGRIPRVNLVVTEAKSDKPLQALSLRCE
jgi:hypothetical protein